MTKEYIVDLALRYWPLLLGATLSVLNGLLGNYRDKPKALRWLHTAIDMLSLLQRKDSPGTLKLPIKRSVNQ